MEERACLLLEVGVYTFGKPIEGEGVEPMEVLPAVKGQEDDLEEVDFGGSSSKEPLPRDPAWQPLKRQRFRQKEAPQEFVPGRTGQLSQRPWRTGLLDD